MPTLMYILDIAKQVCYKNAEGQIAEGKTSKKLSLKTVENFVSKEKDRKLLCSLIVSIDE